MCINQPEYIHIDENSIAHMSSYALAHVDECCLLFDVGYTYESKAETLVQLMKEKKC